MPLRLLQLASVGLMLVAALPAAIAAAAAGFVPVTAGPWAEINAKDGDAAFNTEYFPAGDFRSPPATSRLEPSVGSAPVSGDLARGHSVRWFATLTPKRPGLFRLGLRSRGAAVLKLDGKVLAQHPANRANFDARTIAEVPLQAARPYELVVEFHNPDGTGRVALDWAEPAPLLVTARSAAPTESAAGPPAGAPVGPELRRENAAYQLESGPDGAVRLTEKASGAAALFRPEFAVVHQTPGRETKMDTKGGKYQDDGPVGDTNYVVPSWDKETDFLVAAHPRTRLRAEAVRGHGAALAWQFPAQPGYTLSAELSLPEGDAPPRLRFQLTTRAAGQFSVGYVGAPEIDPGAADWIWQPLVWTDRRFPNRSYLTKEFQCPIPWVMTGRDGATIGVGADPAEMPYRMPTISDSRFGVLVRNASGRAQPILFAPVLGGPESAMPAGRQYAFTLRLLVRRGGWYDSYKHLARALYGFSDIRENGLCSLNTTIDNLTRFLLTDEYSYWFERYKTWGYQNDGGPGAGRQQSAADALGIAIVRDDPEFLRRRALPTLEYMLSRNTVSIHFDQPRFMGGFVNNATDLVSAYRLTGGRSTSIREWFTRTDGAETGKKPPPPGRNEIFAARIALIAELAAYRLTGDKAALARASAAADRYIALRVDRPATTFGDVGSSFWNELAAAYDLLYELYQETGDKRHLAAAARAMEEFTAYVYLVPVIPAGNFTAHPGGRYNNQPVPEDIVPAWRVSPNGLTAECAGTAHSHRGVYMASYPSYMARLARDTGETFFRDIARNAIVGRYANYPSYAYRNGFTTVHQQRDYPLRPFEEIKKFTSAHYNHPLPMTAFLIDYLVSEAYLRSDGAIDFPSEYTNTGAFFRNKVYGVRPGRFHDDSGVTLWLPEGLVRADSIQVNYVAGHGNGRFYLALANQSAQPLTATVTMDPLRVRMVGTHAARIWQGAGPAEKTTVVDGRITVTIPAKGQVSLAIDDARVTTALQAAILDPGSVPLPPGASATVNSPFGPVTATALRIGRGLTTVHVWAKAGPKELSFARVAWAAGRQSGEVDVDRFPFEVTLPVEDAADAFTAAVTATTPAGEVAAPELRVRLR